MLYIKALQAALPFSQNPLFLKKKKKIIHVFHCFGLYTGLANSLNICSNKPILISFATVT
jgi:hypothetical protein